MFIKRAKSRPSLRAREADDDDAPSTSGSPLAKSSVTPAGEDDAAGDLSMDIDEDGGSGSVMERKKLQAKGKRKDKEVVKKASRLSFGGDELEVGVVCRCLRWSRC
jgi:GC-rich sequence DNA-binding factor